MGKWGYPQKATHAAGEVRPSSYDLIMVPGGMAPDFMRRDGGMIHFMRDAVAGQKPLAAICHGLWMLCSTDVLKGRRCTSFYAVAHDVANAGGRWVDEECVVDGSLITSRCPDDLPAFMSAVLEQLAGETPKGRKGHPIAPAWLAGTLAAESRG
jgi:protease I